MTTTLTSTGSTTDTPLTPLVPETGAAFATATVQSARRTFLQYLRTPQLLVLPTVIGAMFLFIFRYVFGGAIDAGNGVDYVDFLIPGFLVTMILWIGMESPAGVAEDAASGVHDRLRSLPIPRAAVMIGRSLADTAFTAWGMLVATALAFAVGFRLDADLASVALAVALILVATYSFMWVFITIGLVSRSAQAAQAMATLFVIPLAFVSSAYVPADSLPSWMQPVAENQPFSVITNAVRSLTLGGTDAAGVGHTTAYWVALSLAWCAGILVVFGSLAVRRFARRR
jgi:ABC-2 type transport system permease protein